MLRYNVAQRTRELGLRLALGAQPRTLRAMVLKQVGAIAAVGSRSGSRPRSPWAGSAARAALRALGQRPCDDRRRRGNLLAVVLAAAYVPARRASNVAPLEALRYD